MQILNYGGMAADSINNLSNALSMRNDRKAAEERAKQTQLARQQAAELFKSNASPDEIAAFSLQNPAIAEDISKQIAFKNDATRQNMTESMREILVNPNGTEDVIQARAKLVAEQGGDPTQTLAELERYRADPKAYNQMIEKSYATLDPKGYQAYKSTLPKQADPMSEYDRARLGLQQAELGMRREDMNFNRQLKKLEFEERRAERALKSADNDIKRQKAQIDLDNARMEQDAAKKEQKSSMDSSYSSFVDTINLADEILKHEGFSSAIGVNSIIPTIPGSSAAGVNGLIDTLSSQNFLNSIQSMKGMGALSDAEGKKLSSAVASLNTNMSEKDFKNQINVIKNITNRAKSKMESSYSSKGDPILYQHLF